MTALYRERVHGLFLYQQRRKVSSDMGNTFLGLDIMEEKSQGPVFGEEDTVSPVVSVEKLGAAGRR